MKNYKKIILFFLAFGLFLVGGVFIWASTIKLPDINSFETRKVANSSKITDKTGEIVLYDIHQSVRRTEIPLDQMGINVQNAVISIEDQDFYKHDGIRVSSIARALFNDLITGKFSQGGSTITQQIVKNTLLDSDKTVVRKLKEWVLAIRLERQLSKREILQIYLNDAPYGGTIYGVEEASQAFFNVHVADLSLAQAAYLAAIPNAPSYYSPFGKNKNKLDERKNTVLKKELDLGYITQKQYDQAKVEKVVFNVTATNSIKAPHFVFYILDYLQQKYGADVMENGGYTIQTTLDYDLQQKAEASVAQYAKDNLKKYNASNSGMVVIDPKTGQILAMVGSSDYFSKTIDGAYNIATAKRQPGSSFKPFVYLTAFTKGYTPDTVLFDVPTEFSTHCDPEMKPLAGYTDKDCYNPSNFDNKFRGPISLRSAIAESRNVPSVKLLYLVGLDNALTTAKSLGISTLGDKSNYGLSLVLGGGEVTLLDMTDAYAGFANSGFHNNSVGILSVKDAHGNVLESFQQAGEQVIDKNAVLTLNDVLSDPKPRIPTFGDSITIPGVAVKTGTTNDDRDAWIIGYTPDIAVGVWSGNNDNSKMKSGGGAISGPIWKNFMQQVLPTTPQTPFEKPIPNPNYSALKPVLRGSWMGNESVMIDKVTGLLATANTPIESQIEKIITNVHDILFWINKDDPTGPVPSNPDNDPEYHLWEVGVQNWWKENSSKYSITTSSSLPTGFDTVHTGVVNNSIIITIPTQLKNTDTTTISLTQTDTTHPLTSVDIFIDDNYITTLSNPFKFIFNPKDYGILPGNHTIRAAGVDTVFNKISSSKDFLIN